MEQKKLDINSIVGFVLIFGILIWIMYQNQPDPKVIAAEKAQKELVAKAAKAKELEQKSIEKAAVAVAATATAAFSIDFCSNSFALAALATNSFCAFSAAITFGSG